MNRSSLICLLALCSIQLSACTICADTNGTSDEPPVETRGQQFSRCLNNHSAEECDRMISGSNPRRNGGY